MEINVEYIWSEEQAVLLNNSEVGRREYFLDAVTRF